VAFLGALPPRDPASFCQASRTDAPSRDLYCIELTPAPDYPDIHGVATLGRAASPFGIAVTPEGVQRFQLSLNITGLPETPHAYLAWVTTPTFDTMIRLGAVRNGENRLTEVAFNKFLVLVSAESSDTVTVRRGPLVLRGGSPGTIMSPHGVNRLPPAATDGHAHHDGGWEMPAPYPSVTPMVPGLEAMRPRAMPYLPDVGHGGPTHEIPVARPREWLSLKDGDTLELTAGLVRRSIAGRSIIMYGFNGQYPGPLLEVRRRTTITVRFRNRLDQPSSVHWHGLRLDNRSDGVPGMTQQSVAPGGSFTYRLTFPDAGIYWYHPHVREDTQQDLGLYGNLLVRSEDPDYLERADQELVLMLDDLLLGEAGLIPFGRERATHALMGRFGNLALVNGEPDYRAEIVAGQVVRLYLTNVSNVRSWNPSLPGSRMKVVAGDASRFEREEWVDNVAIAPAERYVVDLRFDSAGTYQLLNRVQALDHQTGAYLPEVDTLGVFQVGPARNRTDRKDFERLRTSSDVDPGLRDSLAAPPAKTFLLTVRVTEDSLPFGAIQAMRLDTAFVNPVEWSGTMPMMDWLSTSGEVHWTIRDLASGRDNMAIDWHVRRGSLAHVRLVNDRHTLHAMQHPMHLHGQRFLVLAQNEVPTDNLVWKDTALVPAGGTLDLLVDFSNPGHWMLHCHIAEHLEAGLHAMVVVA
jgi:FtsP/CotA-like multicopper oxidase with cupredoxin domain